MATNLRTKIGKPSQYTMIIFHANNLYLNSVNNNIHLIVLLKTHTL